MSQTVKMNLKVFISNKEFHKNFKEQSEKTGRKRENDHQNLFRNFCKGKRVLNKKTHLRNAFSCCTVEA